MNLGFSGNARSRPRVNIGGNRKELTREQLLHRATVERQERHEARQRECGARLIQKSWHVKRARIAALDVLRSAFDQLWPDFEKHFQSGATLKECLYERPVFRLYKFFISPKRDLRRTMAVVQFVQRYDVSGLGEKYAAEENLASALLPCFAATQLSQDSSMSVSNVSEMDDEIGEILIKGTAKAMLWSTPPGAVFLSSAYCRSHYEMLSAASASSLRLNLPNTEQQAVLDAVIRCLVVPLTLKQKSNAYHEFFAFILPILVSETGQEDPSPLLGRLKELPVSDLIQAFQEIASTTASESDMGARVNHTRLERQLNAFILLTHQNLTSQPQLRDDWIEVLCSIMLQINSVQSTATSQLESPSSYSRRSRRSSSISEKRESFIATASPFTDQTILSTLLRPNPARRLPHMIGTLFLCYPALKESLLLSLSLTISDPTYKHNLLQTSYEWWKEEMSSQNGQYNDLAALPRSQVFYLELLSRVLLTMVDDEFFDANKRPFDIEMVKDTARHLKDMAFDINSDQRFDSREAQNRALPHGYHQDILARILQQIQSRNARRTFLPHDFWLNAKNAPVLKPYTAIEAFRSDQESEDENGTHRPCGSAMVRMLVNCPFMFAFRDRIQSLQALINQDRQDRGYDEYWHSGGRGQHVSCRRGHEFEDGFADLWSVGGDIRTKLSVNFLDVHGLPEAGIDGGGLTKEFLMAACKQAFNPDFGLFVETPEHLLYPNPSQSAKSSSRLQQYEFLGRLIALCIYSNILVDVAFAPFFLLRWVGKLAYIDDLYGMDKDLYNGLLLLKNYAGDVEKDFSLDFTVDEDDGETKRSVNLVPKGSELPVTRQNRLRYIHLLCNYKLNVRLERQTNAFVTGMSSIMDLRWLGMFSRSEVQALVGGNPVPIDLQDLRKNTCYGGYVEDDETVKIFWEVVTSFSDEEKRKLIKFVTSTPRPPLLGFKELNPKFALRWAGNDTQRLPTASTCVNLLKLPAYKTHEQLREKLKFSINAEAGFDLS